MKFRARLSTATARSALMTAGFAAVACLATTAVRAQNSPLANESSPNAGASSPNAGASDGSGSVTWPAASDYAHAAAGNADWVLPAKSYTGNRYVTADQITPQNVSGLKPAWTFKMSDFGPVETAPIVWHGTMYVTSAHDHVYALDAATGQQKWEFSDNPHVIAFAANRGVALMDGKVFIATLDGHLVALDATTGKKVWDKLEVTDTKNSFYTMAPVPYRNAAGQDMLLLGVSNGDWGGIGNISAFDPKDGHRIWQWDTIPGPGQPGHDTWAGDSWKRGGAAAWSGMALDPAAQTLFLALGNPQPDFLGTARAGSNLYTNSLVALDISGKEPKLKWYRQFIPHDTHDWDPAMPPVLFQGKVGGQTRNLVATGDKGGNFWILDSGDGKLVDKTVVSFQHGQNTQPSATGTVACPNTNGGVEYNGGSYDPATNSFMVPSINECGLWKSTQQAVYIAGQFYLGGIFPTFVGPNTGEMNAIDVSTGVFNWRHHFDLPAAGGALTTSTGLVFTGELSGKFDAFDDKTGKMLWQADTGASIIAPPMSYELGGKQYIAVGSGTAGNQKVPELKTTANESIITAYTAQ